MYPTFNQKCSEHYLSYGSSFIKENNSGEQFLHWNYYVWCFFYFTVFTSYFEELNY